MTVTGTWVDTGKQEREETGKEFLIYLVRVILRWVRIDFVFLSPMCMHYKNLVMQ